ncbi:MAG: energy transducer TonB [Candidatus Baltobacteraceae bacterium]
MTCDHPPIPSHVVPPHSAKPFSALRRPYATVVALVNQNGVVTSAWIDNSSGNTEYDNASVAAMKQWTFVPAAAGCKALPGESEFVVGGAEQTFAAPCDHAAVATLPVTPQFPQVALQANVPAAVDVTVSLNQFGEVVKLAIAQNSGSPGVDDAAVKAAKASNYFPAVRNCMPVAADYHFRTGITP